MFPQTGSPTPLTLTISGMNQFLTEAHNVFQSPHDVKEFLVTDSDKVMVLLLDMGTSCVVGPMVLLAIGQTLATLWWGPGGKKKSNKKMRYSRCKPGRHKWQSVVAKAQQQAKQLEQTRHFDLVMKCRAMSQLMDSFGKWL